MNNIETINNIDTIYEKTYFYQSEPPIKLYKDEDECKEGEKNLFTTIGATLSKDIDFKTWELKDQGSYCITDYIDIGTDNTNKSLIFRLHIKTVFYDEKYNRVGYLETLEYPEHVEIKIPENTRYIKTIYCFHDEKILYIVKRDEKYPYFSHNNDTEILLPDIELSDEYKDKTLLYVDELGFKGDGVYDNSQALLNLEAIIERNSKWHNDKIFTVVFGTGTYKFEHIHMDFLSRKHTPKNCVFGIRFIGQGVGTVIKYVPKDPEGIEGEEHFFIKNNNKYANMTFSHFKFEGDAYRKSSFMKLTAAPYPQHIVFEKVMFNCVNTTVELKGCDCGSEIMFDNCKWNGTNENVLKAIRPGISSQFLNYWFINPDFQCTKGSLVNLELGGNVNIIGGNLIHKNTGGGFVPGGTFFKLGYDWRSENFKSEQQLGICRFLCEGVRFETHVNRNSRIMESYWDKNGSIMFINCDDGAKNGSGIKTTAWYPITDKFGNTYDKEGRKIIEGYITNENGEKVKAEPVKKELKLIADEYQNDYSKLLKKGNVTDEKLLKEFKFFLFNGAPSIKFENCILHGRHEYDVSQNNDINVNGIQNAIIYDGCIISGKQNMITPWDFIIVKEKEIDDGYWNAAHITPTIKFLNLPKEWEQYNGCCYKNRSLYKGICQKRYINLKDAYGFLPFNEKTIQTTKIIEGALITGLILYMPENVLDYPAKTAKNNIEISLIKIGDTNATPHILFNLHDDELFIDGEGNTEIQENLEWNGFSYNIQFKNPIFVPANHGIRFKRTSTSNAWAIKDKTTAMIEFI